MSSTSLTTPVSYRWDWFRLKAARDYFRIEPQGFPFCNRRCCLSSDKSCRENHNTHFVLNNFFLSKIVSFMRHCGKKDSTREATGDNKTRRMRIVRSQDCEKLLLASYRRPRTFLCWCVCPHGPIRLSLDGFAWSFIKTWQENCAVHDYLYTSVTISLNSS
jgi:hypothetical protein